MLKIKNKMSDYYEEQSSEFPVSFIPHRSGTYRIEVNDAIENVSQFSSAIQLLGMAKEDDEVEIHLQSPGGNLCAADAFIHGMRKCKAPIHIVATGGCSSAASAILLESDSFELSDQFYSLVHCGSVGSGGTSAEFAASAQFNIKYMQDWMRKTYEGFLTPDEMEQLIKGKDFFFDAPQWCERALNRLEYFKAKIAEANKPAKKPRKKKVVDKVE